jgi:hypothetical protein
MKYDDCVDDVCARQGYTKSEAESLLSALDAAETRYLGFGAFSPETATRDWVEAKSSAYNDVQRFRARLWDLNDAEVE